MRAVIKAIARSEWFPNKLPCIFSRENLKVVNRTISHSDCSAIALGVLSSQGNGGDRIWGGEYCRFKRDRS
ncbi:hypothetical protein [Cylindrospermopsis raciborskii]|uniref:hypothetical protein n=1 Tax=Cylindrospermopsis raciborskii TaxID=77022 RepID=UPI00128FB7D3|nr:hypothetical protein [Cylindrospermopsis raciborskii]